MSAASHLSSFSQASHISRTKTNSSLSSRENQTRRKDVNSSNDRPKTLSVTVLKNNKRNVANISPTPNKVPLSKTVVPKAQSSSPMVNGSPRANAKVSAAQTTKSATQSRSGITKPSLSNQQARPNKNVPSTIASQGHLTAKAEQNRVRNLKTAPGIVKSGHHQPDLLNLSSAAATKAEADREISRLEALCETQAKENGRLKGLVEQRTIGFEAFAVMVKYLVEDLESFSHPAMVREMHSLRSSLESCKEDFSQAILERESLQSKIADLIQSHEEKLNKMKQEQTEELESLREELRKNYENEFYRTKQEHVENEEKLKEKQLDEMNDLQKRHDEAVQGMNEEHSKQMYQMQLKHEGQINDNQAHCRKQVESLTEEHNSIKMSLEQQLQAANSRFNDLNRQKREIEEAILKDTDLKFQFAAAKIADLEKEVDSLKAVIELRNSEIHELRAATNKVKKLEDELHFSEEKVKLLSAKTEDLQAQVDIKNSRERQMSNEQQLLREWFEKESQVNKRLSMENEELQWKLQQNMDTPSLASLLSANSSNVSCEFPRDPIAGCVMTSSTPILAGASDGERSYQRELCKRNLSFTTGKVITGKPQSPVSAREVRTRHRRQRFSISEEETSSTRMDISPGCRYRKAHSLSWTVGIMPTTPRVKSNHPELYEVSRIEHGNYDSLLTLEDKEIDEKFSKEIEDAKVELNTEPLLFEEVHKNGSSEKINGKVFHEEENVVSPCEIIEDKAENTKVVLPENADVITGKIIERRKSITPDARVPSLITAQYLGEQNQTSPQRVVRFRRHSLNEETSNRFLRSPSSPRNYFKSKSARSSPNKVKVCRQRSLSEVKNEKLPSSRTASDNLEISNPEELSATSPHILNESVFLEKELEEEKHLESTTTDLDTIEIDYVMRCGSKLTESQSDIEENNAEEELEAMTATESQEKLERSVTDSEDLSTPLTVSLKCDEKQSSSCDSSPPPEPVDLLQVSEHSHSSRSEESSPRASPQFCGEEEQLSVSPLYAMSPRTSAGESMVLDDIPKHRSEQVRDSSSLLIRRTFPKLYLGHESGSLHSSTVLFDSSGKESPVEECAQSYYSKPDTPESSSLAVAATDSTNIDLSWSDDEESIPSESEI